MVTEGYAYLNGTDPAFWDDSEMIDCNECGERYNYKEYKSETCSDCELK